MKQCPKCNGQGFSQEGGFSGTTVGKCAECNGTGRIPDIEIASKQVCAGCGEWRRPRLTFEGGLQSNREGVLCKSCTSEFNEIIEEDSDE